MKFLLKFCIQQYNEMWLFPSILAGKGVFSGKMGRYIVLPMFAGKGVLLWGGEQVGISAHVGLVGFTSLGRWTGRYLCPCWLGRVSFSRKVDM
jgi:hypothetical protein